MRAMRVKKLDPAGTLVENAARIVTVRLDEMRSFVPAALDPTSDRQQHDLRIAAKRLRYVLEVTGFCFGPAADVARRRARELQGVLGDLHDCDVMLPRVEAHISELRREAAAFVRGLAADAAEIEPTLTARAPQHTAFPGIETLGVHTRARRQLLFERFVQLWTEIDDGGTWSSLQWAVERAVAEARARRAAAERAAAAQRELADAEHAERVAAERARQAARELAAARGEPGPPASAGDRPPGEVRPTLRRVL